MLSLFGALLLAALSAEYFFSRSTSYFLDAIAAFATTFQDSLVATDCDAIEAYLTTFPATFATCFLDTIEPYAATIARLATTFFDANAAAFSTTTTTLSLVAHSCALNWAALWPYAVCLLLFRRHVSKSGVAVLGLSMLGYCEAVCPTCFGSLPSCAFATCGKCAIEVQVAANTAIIVSGAAAGLSLATILKPRWMRIFHLSSINAICSLAQRKPPGTVFSHTDATSLTDVASAVANGQYSLDLAVLKYAELLDKCDLTTTAGKTAADRLERDLKNLSVMAKTGAMAVAAAHSTRDQGGVYSFLWARISEYVPKRGVDDKVTIATATADGASSSSSASAKSVYSASLVRAKDLLTFSETMNLFVMFATSLGLVSTVVLTDFLQHIVYDTMVVRDYPWQVAQELLIVTLRRIEDSDKRYNFVNVLEQVYLPTVMEEALAGAKAAYPKELAVFFRTRGGTPRGNNANPDDASTDTKKAFNGKDTPTSKRCCTTFNADIPRDHKPRELNPDGSCKCRHVCNHWVSDKGPWGRCMGEKGTPGHCRSACDNPSKCDKPVQ